MISKKNATRLQPNSSHCFVCGLASAAGLKMRFQDNGVDTVYSTYTVSDQHQGYPGVTHGGIIAAMLDEVAGRTTMIADPNRFMVTASMNIRYRHPVPTGVPLRVVGTLLKDRGRLAQAHSEIFLPDGTLAAEAELTLAEMPMPQSSEDLERLGWRVYPE